MVVRGTSANKKYMWQEITQKEYFSIQDSARLTGTPLKATSSFTDPEGILPYGYGHPYMETEWGVDESSTIRVESRKRHGENEWKHKYFKAI
jgi:hypothetical protein